MRKWLLLIAVLLAAVVALWFLARKSNNQPMAVPPPQAESKTPAAAPAPPAVPFLRIHFAGGDSIAGDTNSLAFENEFCSTQALALENQTLGKLSHAPGVWFQDRIPADSDGSAQLRPLLGDFLKSEWFFEIDDAPVSPEYVLAIRLDAIRAGIWQTNLRGLLESWTKISTQDIPGGWELKKDRPPNLFRFVYTNDWVLIGCGQDTLPVSDGWSHKGSIPPGGSNWLDAYLDWPHLAQHFPALAKFDFPAVVLQAVGKNGNLEISGKLNLSQPLPRLEAWQVPTNIIPPLTSFTAARSFAPWLQNQHWARLLELSPEPNQVFIWAQGLMPMQTYIAFAVPNATNALAQLGHNLKADTNWENHLISPFRMEVANNRIFWNRVPFIGPQVEAFHQPRGDFLYAEIFPNLPRGEGLPAGLYQTFNRDGLVYYHWELTRARLKSLSAPTQLALMLTQHQQLNSQSVAARWLNQLDSSPEPSVTEAFQTGPSEIAFERTSHTGLNAFELVALANWLEAPNFPGCDLQLPPTPFGPMQTPVKTLSAPSAPH